MAAVLHLVRLSSLGHAVTTSCHGGAPSPLAGLPHASEEQEPIMSVSLKPVQEQVIVITGASSGIGLATALKAAERGARLVLAARSEQTLNELADGITRAGGETVAVTADVGNRPELERVAETALSRFGRIDTWINNAGVSIYG